MILKSGQAKKGVVLLHSGSPGEKMVQANKQERVHKKETNHMMLRKVLSPDITPPISDEEDTNIGIYQSESIKETLGNKERVNKPNQEQTFQVKKRTDELYDEAHISAATIITVLNSI